MPTNYDTPCRSSQNADKGGGGSKNPKKLSTWFIDDPITHLSINGPSDREGQVNSALIN